MHMVCIDGERAGVARDDIRRMSTRPVSTSKAWDECERSAVWQTGRMARPNDPDGNWYARMHPEMLEFGDRIRTFRLSHGWSQRQLARRVGLSQSGISRLERGLTPEVRYGRVVGLINLMYGKPDNNPTGG